MAVTATASATSATAAQEQPRQPIWRRPSLIAWLWIGPAVIIAAVFLVYPVIYTAWLSLLNRYSTEFVGLANYKTVFTNPNYLTVLRNNIIWIVLGTAFTVALGLVIAVLVDRVRFESVFKSAIFIPMAISFVGAGVIWLFVYAYSPPGTKQFGLLNAFVTRFGGQPQAWLIGGANNLFLIAVYIWMWTGFCMVILSAALKGIPADILEAARIDGANELQIFFRVIIPMISPTIFVVATTMVINLLKIFDIVYVMGSGGAYDNNVVALSFYQNYFNFNNFGLASALAVILLIAVIPIMLVNIRRFRLQEAQR
jgi:alpha-glucoside transport system permease protein